MQNNPNFVIFFTPNFPYLYFGYVICKILQNKKDWNVPASVFAYFFSSFSPFSFSLFSSSIFSLHVTPTAIADQTSFFTPKNTSGSFLVPFPFFLSVFAYRSISAWRILASFAAEYCRGRAFLPFGRFCQPECPGLSLPG